MNKSLSDGEKVEIRFVNTYIVNVDSEDDKDPQVLMDKIQSGEIAFESPERTEIWKNGVKIASDTETGESMKKKIKENDDMAGVMSEKNDDMLKKGDVVQVHVIHDFEVPEDMTVDDVEDKVSKGEIVFMDPENPEVALPGKVDIYKDGVIIGGDSEEPEEVPGAEGEAPEAGEVAEGNKALALKLIQGNL